MGTALAPHIEAVSRHFWGDPNPRLSSKDQLRWGNQGSRSVDVEKGVWYDNEAGEGGGVLDLVQREAGLKNGEAVKLLREHVGLEIADDRSIIALTASRKIVSTYDYVDEQGEVLFQVVRYEPKEFRQRRPDGDGWSWSVKGVRQIPYRLPEVIEALAAGRTIFIVEGEKDVDALRAAGIPATCNAGGAGKWPAGFADIFKGAKVVVLPDNDEAGRKHASLVGAALSPLAASVKILALPGLPLKGDATDWLQAGGTSQALHALADTHGEPFGRSPPPSTFGAILFSEIDTVCLRRLEMSRFLPVRDVSVSGEVGRRAGAEPPHRAGPDRRPQPDPRRRWSLSTERSEALFKAPQPTLNMWLVWSRRLGPLPPRTAGA